MSQPSFTIDRSVKEHEGEGVTILSGFLDGESIRVQVNNDVWTMVLEHFWENGTAERGQTPPVAYDALEKIGSLIMERRGIPAYGVLSISLG